MTKTFKVIVAGGRDFIDYSLTESTLNKLLINIKFPKIVCGKARGADAMGDEYAKNHELPVQYFPADWDEYGKSAGYIRNEEMAEYADALVAFWDGKSKGTKHMIDLAEKHGLKVRVIYYDKS